VNCGASAGKARAKQEGESGFTAKPLDVRKKVNCGASAGKARAKQEGKALERGPLNIGSAVFYFTTDWKRLELSRLVNWLLVEAKVTSRTPPLELMVVLSMACFSVSVPLILL
jgi:hypothetical protein